MILLVASQWEMATFLCSSNIVGWWVCWHSIVINYAIMVTQPERMKNRTEKKRRLVRCEIQEQMH